MDKKIINRENKCSKNIQSVGACWKNGKVQILSKTSLSPVYIEKKSKYVVYVFRSKNFTSAWFTCSVQKLLQVRGLRVLSETFLSPEARRKKTKSVYHRKKVKVQTREGVRLESNAERDGIGG